MTKDDDRKAESPVPGPRPRPPAAPGAKKFAPGSPEMAALSDRLVASMVESIRNSGDKKK